MLKQLKAEVKCFKRKFKNIEEAIEEKDFRQIEIELASLKNEFQSLQEEIWCIDEELSQLEETMFNVELVPMVVVGGVK